MRFLLALLAASLIAATPASAQTAPDPADVVVIDTTQGQVKIALRPDLAPKHAERIKQLANEGFYDNAPFHRVISGFMAQTGDPTGTGMGKSKLPDLPAEISTQSFVRGTVGMARGGSMDSANSQFFICFAPSTWLDGQYTVIGNVISGMDVVDKLKKGSGQSGFVSQPDKIIKARVGA